MFEGMVDSEGEYARVENIMFGHEFKSDRRKI